MKDELRLYCMNEGFNEEHLLSLIAEDKRLLRLENKRAKKSRSIPELASKKVCEEQGER